MSSINKKKHQPCAEMSREKSSSTMSSGGRCVLEKEKRETTSKKKEFKHLLNSLCCFRAELKNTYFWTEKTPMKKKKKHNTVEFSNLIGQKILIR